MTATVRRTAPSTRNRFLPPPDPSFYVFTEHAARMIAELDREFDIQPCDWCPPRWLQDRDVIYLANVLYFRACRALRTAPEQLADPELERCLRIVRYVDRLDRREAYPMYDGSVPG